LNANSISRDPLSAQIPKSIPVASVGFTAYSRLAGSGTGSVVGVYDRAINMVLPRGLVCLVAEEVERGPINMTVRLPAGRPSLSSLGLQIGDKVRVHHLTLELGHGHRASFGSAKIYSPGQRPKLDLLEKDEIAANLQAMRSVVLGRGNMGGLGGLMALLLPGAEGPAAVKLNMFASAALFGMASLEQAFHSEDARLLGEAIRGLIGLGPGLTPSADDMLAGLVLMCMIYSKEAGHLRRASELVARTTVAEAHGRTTIISEEYLGQAALGRGNERALRLCEALLTGGRESVARETKRVLAIGATSGTDTVLGISLGLMFCTGGRSGLARRDSG